MQAQYEIKYLIASWEPESINHETYFHERSTLGDSTKAIKRTWTYEHFAKNGFGKIIASDIRTFDPHVRNKKGLTPEDCVVTVLFGKD